MSLLAVLSLYMFVLFRRERSEAMAFVAEDGHDGHGHAAPVADHGHGGHAPATPMHHAPMVAAPAKKKRRFVWRTVRIWLPIVLGFGAQAYLDFGGHAYYQETIKPMLEKSSAS